MNECVRWSYFLRLVEDQSGDGKMAEDSGRIEGQDWWLTSWKNQGSIIEYWGGIEGKKQRQISRVLIAIVPTRGHAEL